MVLSLAAPYPGNAAQWVSGEFISESTAGQGQPSSRNGRP